MSLTCPKGVQVDCIPMCIEATAAPFESVTVALQGLDADIVTGFFMVKTIKDTLQNVSLLDSM